MSVPNKIADVNKARAWRGVTARVGRYLARSNLQYPSLQDANRTMSTTVKHLLNLVNTRQGTISGKYHTLFVALHFRNLPQKAHRARRFFTRNCWTLRRKKREYHFSVHVLVTLIQRSTRRGIHGQTTVSETLAYIRRTMCQRAMPGPYSSTGRQRLSPRKGL